MILRISLILAVLSSICTPCFGSSTGPADALNNGINQAIRILEDPFYKDIDQRQAQLDRLWEVVEQIFDFREFSRQVLARNWRDFTPAQRKEFTEIFARFLRYTYLGIAQEKYKDERVIVLSQESITESKALVKTKLLWKGLEIPIDFHMMRRSEVWGIYDVVVLGISAARNYRAQFKSLLQKETPAQVIERLRELASRAKIRDENSRSMLSRADALPTPVPRTPRVKRSMQGTE
jgi:phospholipid transport system substrate-binding protein